MDGEDAAAGRDDEVGFEWVAVGKGVREVDGLLADAKASPPGGFRVESFARQGFRMEREFDIAVKCVDVGNFESVVKGLE
jgi:hypothetical protein